MTIVLTGGGSGGHITPLMAIAAELKRIDSTTKIVYIGQKGDRFADIPAKEDSIDEVYLVRAGKFRRFHGEGWKQFLDISTLLQNFRDFFYVLIGIIQSWKLTDRLKPDLVFSRGGYVSVPVSLGAHLNQIPYITHDSDSVPSLANRIIARWAKLHCVALPKEIYPYPQDKTVTTGIPISDKFVRVTPELTKDYRSKLDIPDKAKLVFVIGGGLGSQTINMAASTALSHLLGEFSDLRVVHIAGGSNEVETRSMYDEALESKDKGRVEVMGYIDNVYLYSGAADVIVTRAGGTNLAEFSMQGKACVVIPSSFLTGGHQLKNAEVLADKGAVAIAYEADIEEDANRLATLLSDLLRNKVKKDRLAAAITEFAKPDAAKQIAKLIMDVGENFEDKAA